MEKYPGTSLTDKEEMMLISGRLTWAPALFLSCLGDLDEAISLLPESQAQIGRITKWTAKAIKGRIQVFSGDYAGALVTLKEVVNSGVYALEANFHNAFRQQNNNGKRKRFSPIRHLSMTVTRTVKMATGLTV
ncbi:MAG: hypothetical protein U5K79_15700 [Cyclobacteriaceae bacterium]|nr:hypothetical protein [Cyclobacteriaceae bacterium]